MRHNASIFIEIVNPNGERTVLEREIDRQVFYDYLQALHINKTPFITDDLVMRKQIIEKRKIFVDILYDSIIDSFDKYFETIDTENGYKKEK